jgi:prepilin-type N-terminal cleavage/methylation domain-containing protein
MGGIPSRAFTLIEMLVVMTITAVLIVVSFTAIQAASRAAKTSKALSHVRETGTLVSIYASERNSRLPLSSTSAESMAQGRIQWFQGELAGYFNMNIDWTNPFPLPDIFYDPSLPRDRQHPWG